MKTSIQAALYGLVAAVLAVLVAVGVIDDSQSAAIATAVTAVAAAVIEVVKAGGIRNAVQSEPVRNAVYAAAVATLTVLVAAGVVDDGTSAIVAGILGAILVGGTELARSVVTPVAKMSRESIADH